MTGLGAVKVLELDCITSYLYLISALGVVDKLPKHFAFVP
jgi:hypothetical protein